MARGTFFLICVGACLAFAACNSGPSSSTGSSSGKDEAAILERKAEHIEGLLVRRSEASDVLDALISALPDRAWLTDVVYDAGKVQFKGRAASNNLLADYLSRLGESSSLANIALRSSAMKVVRGRELQEFALEAAVPDIGSTPTPTDAPLTERLEKLEETLPSRQDTAGMLRELQRLAIDAGLQMTKFAPGAEAPGEFTSALPVTIEVSGDLAEFGRYLRGLAELADPWIVEKLSFKAVSADDQRSPVRASITAKAYLLR
jgi:hypothetical protein